MDRVIRQQIRYLRTRDGVQLAWADAGQGPLLVKGAQLAHPPRVRLGEPGVEPLDAVFQRALPLRPLRRARLRDDGLERGRTSPRPLGRGPGDGDRDGGCPRALPCSASRKAGRRVPRFAARHPERVAGLILYGAYAKGYSRAGTPRRAGMPGHRRAGPRRMGAGQPRLPPGVHRDASSRTPRRSR